MVRKLASITLNALTALSPSALMLCLLMLYRGHFSKSAVRAQLHVPTASARPGHAGRVEVTCYAGGGGALVEWTTQDVRGAPRAARRPRFSWILVSHNRYPGVPEVGSRW